MFLFATSLNLNLGLPWLRIPKQSWNYNSCLGSLLISILCTWPSHQRFFAIRISVIEISPVRQRFFTFAILSFHGTFIITLSGAIIQAWSFFTWLWYMAHVSAPYRREEKTTVTPWLTLQLTSIDTCQPFHSLSGSFPKAALAFPIPCLNYHCWRQGLLIDS